MDPVHKKKDGSWWFWDETSACRCGPYPTEKAANIGLEGYAYYYLGGERKPEECDVVEGLHWERG